MMVYGNREGVEALLQKGHAIKFAGPDDENWNKKWNP